MGAAGSRKLGATTARRAPALTSNGGIHGTPAESIRNLGLTVLKSPPHSPKVNAICERVIGTIRRQCLDWLIPLSESHLRSMLKVWVTHYNGERPHSSLKYQTPAAYAATFTATGDRLRNPDQLRRSPVAPPAPVGVQPNRTLTAAG